MSTLPATRPVRNRKPQPRPILSYRLHFPPHAGLPGLLTIWQGKTGQDYELTRIPSDWGVAYAVGKLSQGGPVVTYHVCLDAESGQVGRHECDCDGHSRYGYCKHVRTLLRLHERGELTAELDVPPATEPDYLSEGHSSEPPF